MKEGGAKEIQFPLKSFISSCPNSTAVRIDNNKPISKSGHQEANSQNSY
jgi:hypothetical protein